MSVLMLDAKCQHVGVSRVCEKLKTQERVPGSVSGNQRGLSGGSVNYAETDALVGISPMGQVCSGEEPALEGGQGLGLERTSLASGFRHPPTLWDFKKNKMQLISIRDVQEFS